MRRIGWILLCLLFPVVMMAREPGTVNGTITINKKPKKLSYAYAWKEPSQFTKGQINTIVVLSDVKLDDATLADRFAMINLSRKGALTGVQVQFNPTGDAESGTFYTGVEEGYFDASGVHKWVKKTFSPSVVEGHLSTDGEHKFFELSYAYSADFKAPIGPAPRK